MAAREPRPAARDLDSLREEGFGDRLDHYAEALELALCFGWIDGQRKPLDDKFFLQRFTPRTKRSRWSKINREKALLLIAAKKMHAAGRAEVERAKADGRWDAAYDSPRNVKPPPQFVKALRASKLEEQFARLDSANRYAMLYRLQHAQKPETRERWIAKFVEMLKTGKRIH